MQRQREIEKLGRRLLQFGYPRLEMAFLVLVTGLAGFLASFVLLHAGIGSMALRYPLAVGCTFIALLVQLRTWLRLRRRWYDDIAQDMADAVDSLSTGASDTGHGGSVDMPGGDLLGSSVEAAAGAEEAAIPLLALIGIAAVALSMLLLAGSLVSSAPFLFAELLVDGAMSASLYRRLRHLPRQHWTQAAVRRTIIPFALTALFLALAGFTMEWAVPGAHTVSQFLHPPHH
jgi:hypothetical protein